MTPLADGQYIFTLLKKLKLACISIYQICKAQSHGEITARTQQTAWVIKNDRYIDPLQAYLQDLCALVTSLKQQKISILIAGDFNEDTTDYGLLHYLQVQHGMIHLAQNQPTSTYIRGIQCIDHALVTTEILPYITHFECQDYPNEYYSDHRPMILCLKIPTSHVPSSQK